jgi:DNA-binding beta-propeller fold protein YncE
MIVNTRIVDAISMSYETIEIEKGSPRYAALNPNTSKMYISYESPDLILIVSIKKREIESKIPANHPGNIHINYIKNKVYVSATFGVYEIDGSTNECNLINKSPDTSSQPLGIQDSPSSLNDHLFAVDSTTNKVYVSQFEEESISVYNGKDSNKLEDTINFKASKWDAGTSTRPSFVLVNEDLRLLYVKAYVTGSAGGGGGGGEELLVVDLNTKKKINTRGLPSTNTQTGFAFNRNSNTIYLKSITGKAIVEYDGYLKKMLDKTTLEKTSVWKRMLGEYTHFAEVIVLNPVTNQVYVSDSKNKVLYEIKAGRRF